MVRLSRLELDWHLCRGTVHGYRADRDACNVVGGDVSVLDITELDRLRGAGYQRHAPSPALNRKARAGPFDGIRA